MIEKSVVKCSCGKDHLLTNEEVENVQKLMSKNKIRTVVDQNTNLVAKETTEIKNLFGKLENSLLPWGNDQMRTLCLIFCENINEIHHNANVSIELLKEELTSDHQDLKNFCYDLHQNIKEFAMILTDFKDQMFIGRKEQENKHRKILNDSMGELENILVSVLSEIKRLKESNDNEESLSHKIKELSNKIEDLKSKKMINVEVNLKGISQDFSSGPKVEASVFKMG